MSSDTEPSPPLLYCHGLDCTWTGTADELVRADAGKPPTCPRCGSIRFGVILGEQAKEAPRIEAKVDSVAEEYERAVIALFQAERALGAAQARAQAALRALNAGILGRAGLE